MNYRIFSLSATGDETAEQSLNGFLARHKIVQVDRQFVDQGDLSYWSMCVSFQPGIGASSMSSTGKKARIDYKDVLDEQQFARFSKLRELRKEMADQDNVPVFGGIRLWLNWIFVLILPTFVMIF